MLALTPHPPRTAQGLRRSSGRGAKAGGKRTLAPGRRKPMPGFVAKVAKATVWLVPTLAVIGAGGWFVASGGATLLTHTAEDKLFAMTAAMGLRVDEVFVEGRAATPREEVLRVLGVRRGDPILSVDPAEAQAALLEIPWVQSVEVERRLPDTLYVRLVERYPVALWQHEGRMVAVDAAGAVLTDRDLGRFHSLPLVIGPGAAAKANALIADLAPYPALAKRVTAATWIGERRWDLHLANGVVVRLPEANQAAALSRLDAEERRTPFLDKDIVAVDLRREDRLVVQMSQGAAERLRPPAPPQRNRS